MLLELFRRPSSTLSTVGDLFINRDYSKPFCNTLEDVVRAKGIKIYGETAIPEGEYIIVLDYSTRFKCIMPHIMQVPNFDGVRIHPFNLATQSEGCIAPGIYDPVVPDFIGHSRDTYNRLYKLLEEAFGRECICISIANRQYGQI